ncbi:SGNH/GDSL hydrolase family protein [Acidicapsa ligni]|uniref:SGNH/GDSL hydrolase family protein n=1 Tax=Acidicapsa ligni TaxID=542300 RepID=UPI0021E02892|nr:SGNH/GDSL hydrolase family protein [Acidicapsa ligni]
MSRRFAYVLFCSLITVSLLVVPARGQGGKIIAEKIEWTWEVTPDHPRADLPNVLLLGDSITRNYFPTVTKELDGKANVYLFATSSAIGDSRLAPQLREFFTMESTHFRVIHFNNGMHGWGFTESEYKAAFPALIEALHTDDPQAKLIWANTTPVKKDNPEGATNVRIVARNDIAASIVKEEKIPIDDQHEVIHQHPDLYSDDVHPNETASAIQGKQVAAMIEKLL